MKAQAIDNSACHHYTHSNRCLHRITGGKQEQQHADQN